MDNNINNNNNQAEILSKSIPDHVIPFIDEHLHRLILTDEVRDYHAIFCKSCNFPIRSGLSYACLPCKFAVHKICPNKTLPKLSIRLPKSEIFDETELKFSDLKSQTLASHGSYQVCLVCGDLCTGTLKYECSKSFGCHESCSLLPAEIQHPLHNHKLILGFPKIEIRNPSLFPCEICCICKSKLQQFNSSRISQVYQCTTCLDFYMHIECAQQMPMIRHSAHEHLLTFLRIKKEVSNRYRDVECKWCRRGWTEEKTDFGVYRCVFCEFSIHESCLKYPKVLENNEEHHHPLQYIVLPAIDHHGGEYEWSKDDYCETCADDIIKTEPIFMCLKCPNEFLFHRDCAIASSQESTEQGYHSMIQFQDLGDLYALFPGWLLPDERKSELMGKIESLTLDLEEDIRILTALKSQSN